MNDLNPDNIPVEQMTAGERFLLTSRRPIPRCEFDSRPFLGQAAETACGTSYDSQENFTFCPNCGNRIKFVTK